MNLIDNIHEKLIYLVFRII